MDFKLEVSALYDRMEQVRLNACEIALWHALAVVSLKCGYTDELSVAMATLEHRTGFSKKALERARDSLSGKGLIAWKSRRGRQSAVYTLVSLTDAQTSPQAYPQTTPQTSPQAYPQTTPQTSPIYSNTTIKEITVDNKWGLPDAQTAPQTAPQSSFVEDPEELEAIQKALDAIFDAAATIGLSTSRDLDRANALVADYSAEWVLEAINRAVDAPPSARCWRYIDGTLKNWRAAGGIDDKKKPAPTDKTVLPPGFKHVRRPKETQ